MLTYVLFVVGFVFLIKGADYLIGGGSAIAKRFGVSDLVIGLTIVSFGTSLPELIVSAIAAAAGNTGVAVGNVIGSNTVNILLVLGLAAVINPVQATEGMIRKEIPFCMLAAVLVAILPNDGFFRGAPTNAVTRIDGLVLLCFMAIFMYYVFQVIRANTTQRIEAPEMRDGLWMPSAKLGVGLIGLCLGGRWVVQGAVAAARALHVGEDVIGLTVVAVGTSLPELATSAVAAYRKNSDIALGNVVGSNIFNVFFVLGIASVIRPLPFLPQNNIDVGVMMGATLLLFLAMLIGRTKFVVQRSEGVFFLIVYVVYVAFLIQRG